MQTLPDAVWSDEKPTTPAANVPGPLLTFASSVDRLCELALERLQCAPDENAVAGAIADLVQARALVAGGAPMNPPVDRHDTPPPPDPEPIAAGRAQLAVALAFAKVSHAVLEFEGIATACARGLDATAQQGRSTTQTET